MKGEDMEHVEGMSRRSFLGGAAIAAAAAAGAGLVGCAPASTTSVNMDASETADVGPSKYVRAADVPSFMVPPAAIEEDQIKETISADVVVVGSGMSGLCCAVSAQESGVKTIVISAGTKATSRGGSNQAIGTKYQAEHGIVDGPQYRRNIVRDEQLAGTLQMNKQLWSRWIMNSGKQMDWTIDKMAAKGLKCSLEVGYKDPDGMLSCVAGSHNFWTDEAPLGVFQGAPLAAQAYADTFTDDLKGTIYFQNRAVQLVRGGQANGTSGKVEAVIAQNADGDYIKYAANKAVVLATGDFSKDEEMMKYFSPTMYEHFKSALVFGKENVDYDVQMNYTGLMDGMGQKMGIWIGAAWQKCYPNPCAINGGAAGPTRYVIDQFWGLAMDKNGNRYMNECTNFAFGALAKLNLPEQTAYSVWDTALAHTQNAWDTLGNTIDNVTGSMPLTPEQEVAYWESQVQSGAWVKADTIEGLLDQLDGLDKKTALETVKRYNEYAVQGVDEEYLVNPSILFPISTPPFYGVKSQGATFLCVMGGLRTNADLQVCEEDDTPIEGLYVVGTGIGDFYANGYNFGLPGQNLGAACGTLPYLLGRDLSKL